MKALLETAPNTLVYRDEPDPGARRVEAVGIYGFDLHAIHGHDQRRPTPIILGHEAAGRVLDGPLAGQRVAVNPLWVPLDCRFAQAGGPHLSPRREILSMPAQHASLAEPIALACHAVHHGGRLLARPLPGARCVVLGAGAIGLAAALVLRQAGAGEVWLSEPNAARRETAMRAGIALSRAPAEGPEDASADLVLDAVGSATTRAACCRAPRVSMCGA